MEGLTGLEELAVEGEVARLKGRRGIGRSIGGLSDVMSRMRLQASSSALRREQVLWIQARMHSREPQ